MRWISVDLWLTHAGILGTIGSGDAYHACTIAWTCKDKIKTFFLGGNQDCDLWLFWVMISWGVFWLSFRLEFKLKLVVFRRKRGNYF